MSYNDSLRTVIEAVDINTVPLDAYRAGFPNLAVKGKWQRLLKFKGVPRGGNNGLRLQPPTIAVLRDIAHPKRHYKQCKILLVHRHS